jgi:hypothetical protein
MLSEDQQNPRKGVKRRNSKNLYLPKRGKKGGGRNGSCDRDKKSCVYVLAFNLCIVVREDLEKGKGD